MLSASSLFSQENLLLWHEHEALTWADFRGVVPPNMPMKAMTSSGPQLQSGYKKQGQTITLQFEVTTTFSPNESWVVDDARVRSILLPHEQLHFDVEELFSRKLRKALQEYQYTANFLNEYTNVYYQLTAERDAYQAQYDLETNHSKIEEKQIEWNQKIREDLASFSKYTQLTFEVEFTLQ